MELVEAQRVRGGDVLSNLARTAPNSTEPHTLTVRSATFDGRTPKVVTLGFTNGTSATVLRVAPVIVVSGPTIAVLRNRAIVRAVGCLVERPRFEFVGSDDQWEAAR
jgi:hypothetical protein